MRAAVKNRLAFFISAAIIYILGFQLIPESFVYQESVKALLLLTLAVLGYFVVLPILYWQLIIKANKQKSWKMILVFSLSFLMARYSFPTNIAEYFEFITWLRYPIIALLLLFEFYFMAMVIRGLWQVRGLKGDPRLHAVKLYSGDERKQSMAVLFAYEVASWFYAIPYFSRFHPNSISHLNLRFNTKLAWFGVMLLLVGCAYFSYFLLNDWSHITALFVSSFILYGAIFLTAYYRVNRYYSLYIQNEYLVVNNGYLSFIFIKLEDIKTVEQVEQNYIPDKESVVAGRKSQINLLVIFNQPQTYFTMMGSLCEEVDQLYLSVTDVEQVKYQLSRPTALVA